MKDEVCGDRDFFYSSFNPSSFILSILIQRELLE